MSIRKKNDHNYTWKAILDFSLECLTPNHANVLHHMNLIQLTIESNGQLIAKQSFNCTNLSLFYFLLCHIYGCSFEVVFRPSVAHPLAKTSFSLVPTNVCTFSI